MGGMLSITSSPRCCMLRMGRESVRVQELQEIDYGQRLDFSVQKVLFHDELEALIFMSDETHFHLEGSVNQQNCAEENPRQLHQRPLHSFRATQREHVIDPYVF